MREGGREGEREIGREGERVSVHGRNSSRNELPAPRPLRLACTATHISTSPPEARGSFLISRGTAQCNSESRLGVSYDGFFGAAPRRGLQTRTARRFMRVRAARDKPCPARACAGLNTPSSIMTLSAQAPPTGSPLRAPDLHTPRTYSYTRSPLLPTAPPPVWAVETAQWKVTPTLVIKKYKHEKDRLVHCSLR